MVLGDKVRVLTDAYPNRCPKGIVCEVIRIEGDGGIWVKRYDRPTEWHLRANEYELLSKLEEVRFSYNYAEEAAKHGIKITCTFPDGTIATFDGSSEC